MKANAIRIGLAAALLACGLAAGAADKDLAPTAANAANAARTVPPAVDSALRNWGMNGFERSGPLKAWVARQAMGSGA